MIKRYNLYGIRPHQFWRYRSCKTECRGKRDGDSAGGMVWKINERKRHMQQAVFLLDFCTESAAWRFSVKSRKKGKARAQKGAFTSGFFAESATWWLIWKSVSQRYLSYWHLCLPLCRCRRLRKGHRRKGCSSWTGKALNPLSCVPHRTTCVPPQGGMTAMNT